jgi:hypothetical protein
MDSTGIAGFQCVSVIESGFQGNDMKRDDVYGAPDRMTRSIAARPAGQRLFKTLLSRLV